MLLNRFIKENDISKEKILLVTFENFNLKKKFKTTLLFKKNIWLSLTEHK